MSTDKKVTKDLIETLEDGKNGYNKAADKLEQSERTDLVGTFRQHATQRAQFSMELENLADAYGDDIDESGSIAAAIHRGWMALSDALTGSDADAVLEAVLQGENHAVSEYEDALSQEISPTLRSVVERQFSEIKAARDFAQTQARTNV